MTPLDYAKISAGASAITGIASSYAQSAGYDIKKYQAKTQAKIAKLQGEADSLQMQRQLNKTLATNTVMAAAQGRSGGSVDGVASAARQQFNWDADFTKMSAKIEEEGYKAQATQYGNASMGSLIGGSLDSTYGALDNYNKSLYKIGDPDA